MSSLLSLLSYGSSSLTQTNASISTTTSNISNVNTAGYSRETTDTKGDPVRTANNLLASQIQSTAGSLSNATTRSDAITNLSTVLTSGDSIDTQLGALMAKISTASATPTDSGARDAVVAAAGSLVSGIQSRAAQVASAQHDTDSQVRDDATNVTSLANQLAAANKAVAQSSDPSALDQRDQIAKQLGALVGGQARVDGDGQMRYVLDGGAVLVDGQHAAALTATTDPTTGLAQLNVVDGASKRDVTSTLTGGQVGAELQFRDQTLTGVASQLDQLAFDVTTSFNSVSSANATATGATGQNMFTPIAQVAGAASKIALDPAITASSQNLAFAKPGAGPGDNSGALAMFALGNANVASGGSKTLGDAAIDIVGNLAQAGVQAKDDATSTGLVASHLDSLRDSLSGVDTNEELTNLARFQNASSAMTKVVSTVNDMLSSLITALS
jgi:flagellar hook-associated protein 1 FlgK